MYMHVHISFFSASKKKTRDPERCPKTTKRKFTFFMALFKNAF